MSETWYVVPAQFALRHPTVVPSAMPDDEQLMMMLERVFAPRQDADEACQTGENKPPVERGVTQ